MKHQGSGNPRKGEDCGHVQCCPMKTGNRKDQEMLASKKEGLLRGKEAGTITSRTRLLDIRNTGVHGPSPEDSSEGQP